ncbi:MAG: nuclear transport factor 2 family protein [Chitinophagaceae bacterium]|nr:nuclear transport factor 2 family protein [Chitinophagaceae bacterium]
MNISLPIFLLSISFASCGTRQSDYSIESKKLLELEKEGIAREFRNDTAFLSSIMDTTFIELSRDKIKNKHEVLKTIYSNNLENLNNKTTPDSFKLEEPVVHLYDNTAVVTFIMHTYRKKEPFERRIRFYDVWVKRDNKWKAITWQASSVD